MPRVAPFIGLRYDAAVVGPLGPLTAPPYDVISEPHRALFAAASPYNAVHLDLGGDAEGDDRYARAAALLGSWEETHVLRRDPEPMYYAYEVEWPATDDVDAGRFAGVFVALTLEPWGGAVLPHEETMPGPVKDRLRLLRATGTHLSPIYGTLHQPHQALADLLSRVTDGAPAEEVVDEEGVRHSLWLVASDEPIASWLADDDLLIADGHHRYTTALAYRDERHAVDGPGPWDTILALVVDTGTQDVPVLPYHRVQMAGRPAVPERALAGLEELRRVLSDTDLRIGVILPGQHEELAYGMLQLTGSPPAVRVLHDALLDELAPGDALRFTHSASDAQEAVRDGAVAAYLLPPTTPDRVLTSIEQGHRLPRKSTFFWPKPRTGMLFMPVR